MGTTIVVTFDRIIFLSAFADNFLGCIILIRLQTLWCFLRIRKWKKGLRMCFNSTFPFWHFPNSHARKIKLTSEFRYSTRWMMMTALWGNRQYDCERTLFPARHVCHPYSCRNCWETFHANFLLHLEIQFSCTGLHDVVNIDGIEVY